jgi:hypothetical protein
MDQPYSSIADTQKSIYDDSGWTFGELGNLQVARRNEGQLFYGVQRDPEV